MPTQKLTLDQFAQQIKAKYPAYQSVDNATLTQKMLAKYPVYVDKVDLGGPPPAQSPSLFDKAVGGATAVTNALGLGGPGGPIDTLGNFGADMYQPKARAATNAPTSNPITGGASAGAQIGLTVPAIEVGAPAAVAVTGKMAEASIAAKVLEMVSPRLTPTQAEKTAVTAPSKIMGKISPIASKYTKQIADAVKGIVNPRKTFSENATTVEKTIVDKAQALKANLKATGKTYTPQELNKALNSVELPDYIKTADKSVQKTATAIINKFKEFGANNKGTLDGLLTARQQFDVWVKQQYPKVFDRTGIAVNDLVKNIRTAGNDFLARKAGDDVAVKASLKEQSLLYEAADVLNEKAAFGAPSSIGEIGTNRFQRFAANNPTVTKALGTVAAGAIGVVGGGEIYKGAKNVGIPLP